MAAQIHDGTTHPVVLPDADGGHSAIGVNQPAEWTVTATGAAGSATATKNGEAGKSHYLTGIIASTAPGGTSLFTIKDDTTAILVGSSFALTGGDGVVSIQFAHPVKITAAKAVSIEVAGSGNTYANLMGFTR